MAKLTSGPFFVPLSVDGSASGAVDFLLIGFKNLAKRTSKVHVSVLNCAETTLYPATPPEVEIFRQKVVIPAGDCAVLRIDAGPNTFTGNNMLRVALHRKKKKDVISKINNPKKLFIKIDGILIWIIFYLELIKVLIRLQY